MRHPESAEKPTQQEPLNCLTREPQTERLYRDGYVQKLYLTLRSLKRFREDSFQMNRGQNTSKLQTESNIWTVCSALALCSELSIRGGKSKNTHANLAFAFTFVDAAEIAPYWEMFYCLFAHEEFVLKIWRWAKAPWPHGYMRTPRASFEILCPLFRNTAV